MDQSTLDVASVDLFSPGPLGHVTTSESERSFGVIPEDINKRAGLYVNTRFVKDGF